MSKKPRIYDLERKCFRTELNAETDRWKCNGEGNLVVVWINDDMDIKKLLMDYKYLPGLIKQTSGEIEIEADNALKYQSSVKAAGMDGMPHGSGVGNPTQEMAVRLAEVNDRLKVLWYKLAELKNNQLLVEIMMDGLEPVEKTIITEKYINDTRITWESLRKKVNYTERGTRNIAYKTLDKMIKLIS